MAEPLYEESLVKHLSGQEDGTRDDRLYPSVPLSGAEAILQHAKALKERNDAAQRAT